MTRGPNIQQSKHNLMTWQEKLAKNHVKDPCSFSCGDRKLSSDQKYRLREPYRKFINQIKLKYTKIVMPVLSLAGCYTQCRCKWLIRPLIHRNARASLDQIGNRLQSPAQTRSFTSFQIAHTHTHMHTRPLLHNPACTNKAGTRGKRWREDPHAGPSPAHQNHNFTSIGCNAARQQALQFSSSLTKERHFVRNSCRSAIKIANSGGI